jgi:hypothetical protein
MENSPNYQPATEQQYAILSEYGYAGPERLSFDDAEHMIELYTPTPAQEDCLVRLGIHPGRPISRQSAWALINDAVEQRRLLPPTEKQEWILKQHDQWRPGMSRGEAFDLIGEIMAGSGSRFG